MLWAPLALIAGAACHLLAPADPPFWWGVSGLAGAATLAALLLLWPSRRPRPWAWRARRIAAALCIAGAAFAAGFVAADVRVARAAHPRLAGETGPVLVEGWVADAESGAPRPRLRLLVRAIEGVSEPPRFVRISTTLAGAQPPGRPVRCRAILRPPEPPLAPGGYDSAYQAFFQKVGGVGFSLGPCRAAAFWPPPDLRDAALIRAAAVRRVVTEIVAEASPGAGGALAAALITGDRSLIDAETNAAFRDSGLGHMLSVSGLHMGVVAGMIYAALHVGLAFFPGAALALPIRKIAAGSALVGAALYLALSGASVPAQRAFVMTAVVLGAVLADRPALTMRGLAVAAILVTLLSPDAVLSPGFQMSFAASAALVAAFERYDARPEAPAAIDPGMLIGGLQKAWRWTAGALTASVVAGLATDPFALHHFQRMAVYALPANLAATPIVSLIVAPAAGAAAVLAPFGLAEAPLRAMAWGLELLTAIGAAFAERPEAVRSLAKPPDATFLCWVLAIAWGCLWRGRLRWAALAPLVLGGGLYLAAPPAALLIDSRAEAAVARASASRAGAAWVLVKTRGGGFEADRLASLAGAGPDAAGLPEPSDCTPARCRWRTPGGRDGVFVLSPEGFADACRRGAIVAARPPAPRDFAARCAPSALLDGPALRARGGAVVVETQGGVRTRHVDPHPTRRPWQASAAPQA